MPRCSSSNNQPTTINDEHRRQTVPAAVFVFDSVALSDWLDGGDNITYLLLRDCVVVEALMYSCEDDDVMDVDRLDVG